MNSLPTRFAQMAFLSIAAFLFPFLLSAQIWAPVPNLPTTDDFKAVHFVNATTGWVCGGNGVMIKTIDGGVNWSLQVTNSTQTLRALFFWDVNTGWTVGDGGTILATTDGGNSWSPQVSGTTNQLYAVQFVSATTGWATGQGSRVLKTIDGGGTWLQQQNQGTDQWGLFMQNATTGWSCGTFNQGQGAPALIKTINGTQWSFQNNTGVNTFLTYDDIYFPDANNGWIVGGLGTIRHTADAGATAWTGQTSGTNFELLSVDFLDANTGYACGRQGVMLHTGDGGITWGAQYTQTYSATIWDVDMISPTAGFAASDNGTLLQYTVSPPAQPIVLLQPNGGEIFQINTKRFIIWQVQPGINNVHIEYSVNGGANWLPVVASTPAATGSYAWNVPNNPSINCLVKVSDVANVNTNDVSNAAFYIMNQPKGVDYSVLMSATTNNAPAQITVSWENDPNALSYSLDRKLPSDPTWTNITTLSGGTNSYLDNNVAVGTVYEYRAVKTTPLVTGYGYIYTGIERPEIDFRGTVLLAVDNTFSTYLTTELDRLVLDLIGDGWRVIRNDFAPTDTDVNIKNWVVNQYNTVPGNVQALLIVGHLAVPYSGNYAPDGHAERIGAQPADVFYGDVDGIWTDATVTTTNVGAIYTPNVPGDGIWDQDAVPSPIEIQVGRIDMSNMPGFAISEADLLKQYFDKNHDFRLRNIDPARRALLNTTMDNQLPSTSATGWRSFAPMVGASQLSNLTQCNNCPDFVDSLEQNSYLWTYMAGGGTDTSCGGATFTSGHCMTRTLNTVFMQTYGSYFVEWANGGLPLPNLLLRAVIANDGMTLCNTWTGTVPRCYFQEMGLGETIGYSMVQSQNNAGNFEIGNVNSYGKIHLAIMGDPTLRLHSVYPISNLVASGCDISWVASPDVAVVGYNVYRSDAVTGIFTKLTPTPINALFYNENNPLTGPNVYMVRAVKLETEASGTYYNMSEGVFTSCEFVDGINPAVNSHKIRVYPSPASQFIFVENVDFSGASVDIYDVMGRLLIQNKTLTTSAKIDISGLANGVYFVKIVGGDGGVLGIERVEVLH